MSAYITPPNFDDNVGQLISAADLEALRQNVGLAEGATWRVSEMFANAGGVETGFTTYYYQSEDGDVRAAWEGYLMIKAGMTTLTVEGRTVSIGNTQLSLWLDGLNKQQWIPGASSWTITQSLAGYSVGQVVKIQIKTQDHGQLTKGGLIFIQDIYGSPLSFTDAWPGVPSFGQQFTASQLAQLSNATSWVINRSGIVPRPAMLSLRYGLGSCSGPDRRPVYSGTVGRYYSAQQLRLGMQIADNQLPDLHVEVMINGVLAWDSGTLAQGTTNLDQWISLDSVPIGSRAEVEIWTNQHATIPRSSYHFSQATIWTCTAMPNDPTIYATPNITPTPDSLISAASLAAYLNNLAGIVSAAKARIDGQPNFFNRVRAQRRWFGRGINENVDELAVKRNPPRFWRCGDALVVHGKGVSLAYGGVNVPTNDKGVAYYDYTWAKTQQIIESDKLATQVLWLDTVPGVVRGMSYYLAGDVRWAEESLL